jgi:cyanate permease
MCVSAFWGFSPMSDFFSELTADLAGASSSYSQLPVMHNFWSLVLLFMLTLTLVSVLSWIWLMRRQQKSGESLFAESEDAFVKERFQVFPEEQPEEIELWRSRLEYLYLDVPAVDPRGSED